MVNEKGSAKITREEFAAAAIIAAKITEESYNVPIRFFASYSAAMEVALFAERDTVPKEDISDLLGFFTRYSAAMELALLDDESIKRTVEICREIDGTGLGASLHGIEGIYS